MVDSALRHTIDEIISRLEFHGYFLVSVGHIGVVEIGGNNKFEVITQGYYICWISNAGSTGLGFDGYGFLDLEQGNLDDLSVIDEGAIQLFEWECLCEFLEIGVIEFFETSERFLFLAVVFLEGIEVTIPYLRPLIKFFDEMLTQKVRGIGAYDLRLELLQSNQVIQQTQIHLSAYQKNINFIEDDVIDELQIEPHCIVHEQVFPFLGWVVFRFIQLHLL